MPKATSCKLYGQIIGVDEALHLRDEARRRRDEGASCTPVGALAALGGATTSAGWHHAGEKVSLPSAKGDEENRWNDSLYHQPEGGEPE